MVLKGILSAATVNMLPPVFSFPPPATAMGLRSTMPVRTASTGRPFRARTTTSTTRGTSTSIRATTARSSATASAGSLFAQSKGSPNSEQRERIQFFSSLILMADSLPEGGSSVPVTTLTRRKRVPSALRRGHNAG